VKPYTRRIPKSISMARLLAEALVKGPTAAERRKGAAVAFPERSAVQSVILRDGILTVDFNERLQNVGGSCRAQMIRESVTRTLLKLPAVKKVVITAGGSEPLALQP
ncbi:MAG TPA: GerMN domain-containing protein, partial [Thermoanaerobaculia bacterium]